MEAGPCPEEGVQWAVQREAEQEGGPPGCTAADFLLPLLMPRLQAPAGGPTLSREPAAGWGAGWRC